MQTNNPHVVDITVIICTRNRASQLSSVLDSACKLVIPIGLLWEFIVVDNGSTDNTADIVGRYAAVLPIRCVREEMAGLSNARNKGVAEAKGQYICWTDDDLIIDPEWLTAYAEAFKRHPEAAVFGGQVIPYLQKPTPEWFERSKYSWPFIHLLAYRNLGEEIIPLTFEGDKVPYGANFAIRTTEQKQHLYNPALGVSPKHKRVGEESDVIYRIFKAGGSGWWVPKSMVTHIIPAKRQTLKYIFDYTFLCGETIAYLRDHQPNDNYLLATGKGPPEYYLNKYQLFKRSAIKILIYIVYTTIRRDNRFISLGQIGILLGLALYRNDQ